MMNNEIDALRVSAQNAIARRPEGIISETTVITQDILDAKEENKLFQLAMLLLDFTRQLNISNEKPSFRQLLWQLLTNLPGIANLIKKAIEIIKS